MSFPRGACHPWLQLIRLEAADIRKTGRSAQGVRLIKTDQGDKVTSASLVEAAAEEETETADER